LWCYAAYMGLLLYLWDGGYRSGTLSGDQVRDQSGTGPLSSSSSKAALFLEVSTEVAATVSTAASASASASAAQSTSDRAREVWFAMQATELWFIGLTGLLILLTVLYVYGSLRMRCKRMGKWGTAMTAFLLLCLSCGTIVFGTMTLRYNKQFVTWPSIAPVVGQMAVAALVLATCLYQMYVSTQVAKLKLAAKSRFNDLLIMTLVAVVAMGVCHYTYYVALHTTPRINLLYLTALSSTVSQVLLLGFGVMLLAWRYALPDEYTAWPAMEKFGMAADEEATPFAVSAGPASDV